MSPSVTEILSTDDALLDNTETSKVPVVKFDYRIPTKMGDNVGVMDYRQMIAALKCPIQPQENHEIIHLSIKKTDGSQIPVDLYRSTVHPNRNNPNQPTLIFIAGTAFFAHELEYTKSACSHIVNETGCQIYVVQHRLAPEEIYPAAINDVISVIDALTADAGKYNIDLASLGLLGYSSGANLAAAAGSLKGAVIKFQILVSGIFSLDRYTLDDEKESKQLAKNEEKDSIVKKGFVEWFIESYAPATHVNRSHPLVSPLRATNFAHWPETSLICGKNDFFLSDNQILSQRLSDNDKLLSFATPGHQGHGLFWNSLETFNLISAQINLTLSSIAKQQSKTAPIPIPSSGSTNSQTTRYSFSQYVKRKAAHERKKERQEGITILPSPSPSSKLFQRSTEIDDRALHDFSSSSSTSSSSDESCDISFDNASDSTRCSDRSSNDSYETSPEASPESSYTTPSYASSSSSTSTYMYNLLVAGLSSLGFDDNNSAARHMKDKAKMGPANKEASPQSNTGNQHAEPEILLHNDEESRHRRPGLRHRGNKQSVDSAMSS